MGDPNFDEPKAWGLKFCLKGGHYLEKGGIKKRRGLRHFGDIKIALPDFTASGIKMYHISISGSFNYLLYYLFL